jgi:hypothetical protein
VDSNTLWLSFTLVDLAEGGDGEGSGNGLVAGSSWVDIWGVGIGGSIGKNLGISLSLTLVNLAQGGDREGSGNRLVAGSSWVDVWGVGIGGSIGENLGISITLANQVTTIAISAIGVGVSISVPISTISIDGWVAICAVQDSSISFGFSSNNGGKSKKSNLKFGHKILT